MSEEEEYLPIYTPSFEASYVLRSDIARRDFHRSANAVNAEYSNVEVMNIPPPPFVALQVHDVKEREEKERVEEER